MGRETNKVITGRWEQRSATQGGGGEGEGEERIAVKIPRK